MKMKFFLAFLCSAFFLGCQQTVDPFEVHSSLKCYLSLVVFSDGSQISYTYDNTNTLTSYSDNQGQNDVITRDQQGRIQQINETSNGQTTIYYFNYDNNNRLVEVNWNNYTQEIRYAYNSSGQLANSTHNNIVNNSAQTVSQLIFTYGSTSSNNYTEVDHFNAYGNLTGKETYEYDSNPTPFPINEDFNFFFRPTNNPIKYTYIQTGATAQITNYSYTYNSNGYRVTQTATGANQYSTQYSYSNCN